MQEMCLFYWFVVLFLLLYLKKIMFLYLLFKFTELLLIFYFFNIIFIGYAHFSRSVKINANHFIILFIYFNIYLNDYCLHNLHWLFYVYTFTVFLSLHLYCMRVTHS